MTGIVDVTDIEPEVFKELLRYNYYSGWMNLLLVCWPPPKKVCEDHIVHTIAEYGVQLLLLDENHPAHYLKGKALDFILQFPVEVMVTERWKKANEVKPDWIVNVKEMLFDVLVRQPKAKK